MTQILTSEKCRTQWPISLSGDFALLRVFHWRAPYLVLCNDWLCNKCRLWRPVFKGTVILPHYFQLYSSELTFLYFDACKSVIVLLSMIQASSAVLQLLLFMYFRHTLMFHLDSEIDMYLLKTWPWYICYGHGKDIVAMEISCAHGQTFFQFWPWPKFCWPWPKFCRPWAEVWKV